MGLLGCFLCSPELHSLSYLLTFKGMGMCVGRSEDFTERVCVCDSVVS